MNEHELLELVEVMVAARLYGHDLRFGHKGSVWDMSLYCVLCRLQQTGTLTFLTHSNWEAPCHGAASVPRDPR